MEELGVLEVGAQLNTHTQKECDDKLGAEICSAECVSIGQEPHYSHPVQAPLNIDAASKYLSEKVSPGAQYGRKEPDNCQSDMKLCPSTHSTLQQRRNHNGREPFKCKICSETFFEKETLAVHVLVHSGTLSFSSWSKAIRM